MLSVIIFPLCMVIHCIHHNHVGMMNRDVIRRGSAPSRTLLSASPLSSSLERDEVTHVSASQGVRGSGWEVRGSGVRESEGSGSQGLENQRDQGVRG